MTDEALVRRARDGDEQAFEQLLMDHYELIFRFAYKWAGNRADAEDITQQACIKLARSIGQFRFESAFATWLYTVVTNCARDYQRSQGRHRGVEVAVSEADEPSTPLPGESGSPEAQVHAWQLLESLDQLGDGLKETLLLVHGEGLSHAEAARVLGVKESTVSWRLHEIRKQFRPSNAEGGTND